MAAWRGSPITTRSVSGLSSRTRLGAVLHVGEHSAHQALCRGAHGTGVIRQPVDGLEVIVGGREQRLAEEGVVDSLRVVTVPRAVLTAEPRVEFSALGR